MSVCVLQNNNNNNNKKLGRFSYKCVIHRQIYQMSVVFVGSFVGIFTLSSPSDSHIRISVQIVAFQPESAAKEHSAGAHMRNKRTQDEFPCSQAASPLQEKHRLDSAWLKVASAGFTITRVQQRASILRSTTTAFTRKKLMLPYMSVTFTTVGCNNNTSCIIGTDSFMWLCFLWLL